MSHLRLPNIQRRGRRLLLCGIGLLALLTPASMPAQAQSGSGASLTMLSDGRWLRLGGMGPSGVLSTAVLVQEDGRESTLPWQLQEPRRGHTATVLPDGRILVIGGVGRDGSLTSTTEVLDAERGVLSVERAAEWLRRAYHSTTLTSDGSLVIVGGYARPDALADSVTWDPSAGTHREWNVPEARRRAQHSAALDAPAGVFVEGGVGQDGRSWRTGQRYGPSGVLTDPSVAVNSKSAAVAGTLPEDGARGISVETRIAVLFGNRVDPSSARVGIRLSSSDGVVGFQTILAENGRLLFLKPSQLEPGTTYQITVESVRDMAASLVPPVSVSFSTAGERPAPPEATDDDEAAARNSPWRRLPPLRAPTGETAISGQLLRLNGQPLPGVLLKIDDRVAYSDRTGRFLLTRLTAGHAELWIDGGPASENGRVYGTFEVGVEVEGRRTSVLPYTIWMPRLDMAHAVDIRSPTPSETVIVTPRLPGLELRIPAGTTIRDHDHRVVRKVSITPVPIDRPPFPLPVGVNVPIYFTIQPGGAYLQNVNGLKARLVYPNLGHQPPGTVFDFWNYDADGRGWYIYGHGKVSPDGAQVVPDAGVGIYEFSGAMVANPALGGNPGPPPNGAEGPGPPGPPSPPPGPTCCDPNPGDGDPVDLATGLFVLKQRDAFLADVFPIRFERVYRHNDTMSRPFGLGATHNFELLLLGDGNPWTYQDWYSRMELASTTRGHLRERPIRRLSTNTRRVPPRTTALESSGTIPIGDSRCGTGPSTRFRRRWV